MCEVKDSSRTVRILPFVFSSDSAYVLEFGHLYVRVISSGAQIRAASQVITAITNANPCVLTYSGSDTYAVGDEIYVSGIVGAIGTYLNNRSFKVAAVNTGTNAITLDYMDGTDVNSTTFGSYTSGGTIEEAYTVTTTYVEADLPELRIVQKDNSIIITHKDYASAALTRTSDTSWAIADLDFSSNDDPVGITALSGTAGSDANAYQITYINKDTGEESLPSGGLQLTATGVTNANPGVVTVAYDTAAFSDSVEFRLSGFVGMVELNGRTLRLTRLSATTFKLWDEEYGAYINTTNYAAWTSGGVIEALAFRSVTLATAASGAPVTITTYVPQAASAGTLNNTTVNIYKYSNGIYGYIGSTITRGNLAGFVDNGIVADTENTPPTGRNPFDKEAKKAMSAATKANPCVITTATHDYSTGQVVYISGVTGMTQLNSNYFKVIVLSATTFSLTDRSGTAIDSSAYSTYTASGNVQRVGYFPATCSYIQQRLALASSRLDTETAHLSRTGLPYNFTISSPSQDDEAIQFTMLGKQVNEINHLVDIGNLVIFTSSGEWAATGGSNGSITPSGIGLKQYSYHGSSSLPPIVIGGNALFVQARGSVVRDLQFEFESDGYRGNELTIFASHLTDGYELVDWTYQQIPHSNVWAIRDDGTMLGLTYVREHQITAWHKHDTDGTYENVCSIPEGSEDAVYTVVKRTINGSTKRYIERSTQRRIDDIVDYVAMDCALTYDGRNTGVITMTLSGSGWTSDDLLTITASSASFTAADIGNEYRLTGSDGTLIRFRLTEYTSTTVMKGHANKDLPVVMRAAAITEWTRAVDSLSGLWHLEGEAVAVFADGFVVASPNNDSYTAVTVANGSITLDAPYGVIHVGIPYICDIETLDVDTVQGESIVDKKKQVSKVTLMVEDSRGIWVGAKAPTDDDDDPLEGLNEAKIRSEENYDDPVALKTGPVDVLIGPAWNSNGRVFIRQVDPVPLSVLAIAPHGLFPFRGGG